MRISSVVYIACICVLFHYSIELVSKSEVRVRMRNFQAFRAFLHNVALIRCKILRETGCQKEHLCLIKQKMDDRKERLAEIRMLLSAFRCTLLL